MLLTVDQVVESIFELPEEAQAEIIQRVRDRLYPLSLTDEQKDIIRAEIAAHDADPDSSISWDELKARLQSQLRPETA